MRALFVIRVLLPIYLLISFILAVAVIVDSMLSVPVGGRQKAKFRDRVIVVWAWPALVVSTRGRRMIARSLRGI
jgi:hypothetical protein